MQDPATKEDLKKALDAFTLNVTIIAGIQMSAFVLAALFILNWH